MIFFLKNIFLHDKRLESYMVFSLQVYIFDMILFTFLCFDNLSIHVVE